jgi:hypothetical protein
VDSAGEWVAVPLSGGSVRPDWGRSSSGLTGRPGEVPPTRWEVLGALATVIAVLVVKFVN